MASWSITAKPAISPVMTSQQAVARWSLVSSASRNSSAKPKTVWPLSKLNDWSKTPSVTGSTIGLRPIRSPPAQSSISWSCALRSACAAGRKKKRSANLPLRNCACRENSPIAPLKPARARNYLSLKATALAAQAKARAIASTKRFCPSRGKSSTSWAPHQINSARMLRSATSARRWASGLAQNSILMICAMKKSSS